MGEITHSTLLNYFVVLKSINLYSEDYAMLFLH